MVLWKTNEVGIDFKDRMTWWLITYITNRKLKIWDDPWLDFILCWMVLDAYLTEISQCDKDHDKLEYFYKNRSDFKDYILSKWDSLCPAKLKELSPIQDMRPKQNRLVYLNDEKDIEEVFNFVYQIRCNLFHGSKDIKNSKDAELVRHGAKFLRASIVGWMEAS